MTLESRINKNRYIGNGATRIFPFNFKAWEKDQVLVITGNGTTEEDVSSSCAVELSETGGTVAFPTPPSTGTIIVIRRNMPYIQEDDYRNGDRFNSEEIEDRFDQDCAERQDLRYDIDRAIRISETSEKTPEEYVAEFWEAYGVVLEKHAEVVEMHDEFMSEMDHQIARAENMAAIVGEDTGNACMEMNWILSAPVAAGSDIDIHPLWYVVGRHHLQVSYNGVRQYRTKQYNEKGDDNSHSNVFTTLVDLNAGDTVNVWICHLSGNDVSSVATPAYDGLLGASDKDKLDTVERGAQVNIIETVRENGTALAIQNKAVNVDVPIKSVKVNGTALTPSDYAVDVSVPVATTTSPKMDGTAAVGSETKWAKGDHVHPSDTTKVDKVTGKGLSTNDFTDALKSKLDGVATGAQVNVIESVKVNGSALTVSSKAVNVQVPVATRSSVVLSSAVSAGTAVAVPNHTVNGGMLFVWHNGVLCRAGSSEQYVDASATTVKFNYNLAAGDVVDAMSIVVGAS